MIRFAAVLVLAGCAAGSPEERASRLRREALHVLSSSPDPAEALPLLDEAIELDPDRRALLILRARIRRRLGRHADAFVDFTDAIRVSRTPAQRGDVLVERGILHGDLGEYGRAETDFADAIAVHPAPAEAHLARAYYRRRSGAPPGTDVERARTLAAGSADLYYNLGVRELHARRLPAAERYFTHAADLRPDMDGAWLGLARVHMEAHRFDEAVAPLDRAIRLRPRSAPLQIHRGNVAAALGRHEEAERYFTRALEISPEDPDALAGRGAARYRMKRYDLAQVDLTRATTLVPGHADAWLALGLLHYERGDLDVAEDCLRAALKARATAEGALALARVLDARGEDAKAASILREALRHCRRDDVRQLLNDFLRGLEASP